ncbi:MAG: Gfo/Idh/MocA family oxidoreductase [Chloroflexi bacterium]|nr:Gfo/Idh/MocA family oxidoreductase [Chloroflexota bacterium]
MNPPSSQSRRAFLGQSSLALSAAALSPRFAFAAEPSANKIRIGVVGGGFGRSFYWHEHPNCTVAAVSDLRPERREALMKTYGCGMSYESLEKLILDKEIDAVAIFTPAPDHVRHSVAALKAGKHVICAVPAAMSLEECRVLVDTVKRAGLTFMMAETSYYQQATISARKFYQESRFGQLFYAESEYHHPGVEALGFENGRRTWRHGFPPMHYPTHCTAHLVGVTGERLTAVSCLGWGDGDPILQDNAYQNPFWAETAFFKTNQGHAFRVAIYWRGAMRGTERAQWYGDKMSFFFPHPNGLGPIIVRRGQPTEKDSGGFVRQLSEFEKYPQPDWWKTDLLPAALRHDSGHEGSHTFLTHEFIDALIHDRKPAVDVYEAVAYTAPGIVAHQSALKGGEQMKVPSFDPG